MFFTWTKKAAPPAVRALYSCLNDTYSLSPPLSFSLSTLFLSLLSPSLIVNGRYLPYRAKKHTKQQQQVIQIPSTALARNRQESYRCVSEHNTHTGAHTTFEYINNLLCVWVCRCCFCKNKPTTWSDSSSTLFEYLFALVFLVIVVVFVPD